MLTQQRTGKLQSLSLVGILTLETQTCLIGALNNEHVYLNHFVNQKLLLVKRELMMHCTRDKVLVLWGLLLPNRLLSVKTMEGP